MATLSETLLDPARRPEVVQALASVVEAEVAGKSGISGAALKTTFAAATKMRPGLTVAAVDKMLPDLSIALEQYWATKGDTPFGQHLAASGDQVADTVLAMADTKVQHEGGSMAKVYSGIRPKAKGYVIDALPKIGATIESFMA